MKPAASGGFDADEGSTSDDAGGRGMDAGGAAAGVGCPVARLVEPMAMPARMATDTATDLGARRVMVSLRRAIKAP